ncbi:FHA domain-containing protein [candidate division KSB1 bacterium]|nr:FHA domain-containing protein [candidate division KSB1 bacterium]
MTSKDTKTEHSANEFDNSQVPVIYEMNQQILEKARQIKNEFDIILDRLAKLDEHQSKVSAVVYQKLKNEYLEKQKEVSFVFENCKAEIRNELKKMLETEQQNENLLKKHQLSLEEVKMRGILGEYDDEKVREIEATENKIIDDFQQVSIKIKNDISILEEILGESFELTSSAELAEASPRNERDDEVINGPGIQTGVILESELSPDFPDEENLLQEIEADESTDANVLNLNDATIAVMAGENQNLVEDLSTGQHANPDEEEATVFVQGLSPENEDQTLEDDSDQSHATIIINDQENVIGEHIFKSECRIGRTKTADIFLKDDTVSRNHALIVRKGDEYHIFDQNSANGVIVNGERVAEAILKNDDLIIIGIFSLIIKIN